VGVTPRVELTIDELVLDGFDEPREAVDAIRDELRRQVPEQLAGRLRPVAAEVAKAAERGTTR
jgi:hypothetical protein